jgi:alpha-1,2-mannosyltransferase
LVWSRFQGHSFKGIHIITLIAQIQAQFGVSIVRDKIIFIPLKSWRYLEAKRYPRLTLILSSIGSLLSGWEAMMQLRPKIFFESVGFAFIYPLAWFFGAKVIAYVHYPTISSDMLKRVVSREAAFNNQAHVAKSALLSSLKLWYYKLFSVIYGYVGSYCDVVMVNSSWTAGHINDIWRIPKRTFLVYPPCDTSSLVEFPFNNREKIIVSVAQFRPEKDHELQIDIIKEMVRRKKHHFGPNGFKLVLIGSVRNGQDLELVENLDRRIRDAGLEVYLCING